MDYKVKNVKPNPECSCSCPQCNVYYVAIQQKAPQEHAWRTPSIRLNTHKSTTHLLATKICVFVRSIQRHMLNIQTASLTSTDYGIYPYHFPVSLVDWWINNPRINITTPLSRDLSGKVCKVISTLIAYVILLTRSTTYTIRNCQKMKRKE